MQRKLSSLKPSVSGLRRAVYGITDIDGGSCHENGQRTRSAAQLTELLIHRVFADADHV